jgi:hypothetical protein
MTFIGFVGWNETGDQASFNDLPTAEDFVAHYGGTIERIGVAFLVTGCKSRDAIASNKAKDVTPDPAKDK